MTAIAAAPIAERAPRQRRSPERIAAATTIVVLIALAVIAVAQSGISIPSMLASRENAERFIARVGTPSLPETAELFGQIGLTLSIVCTGTLLAAVLSIPVAVLAAANTTLGTGWRVAARAIGVLTRAVPDVVLAIVFVLMFSLGSLPGVLAIGIHSIGMISKLFADAIEEIDEGPRLAIRAAGGSKLQEFTAGVLPQVLPSWVATVLHRNDINLRGSVVLGYVGVAGLGLEMSYAFKSLDYSRGIGIAAVLLVLCIVIEIISSSIRAAMLGSAGDRGSWADRLVRKRIRATEAPSEPDERMSTPLRALRQPWSPRRIRNLVAIWAAVALAVLAIIGCQINWGDFLTVWAKIPGVAEQFWPPSFGSYGAGTLFLAMWQTIVIAFAATILTFVPSLILGSFAARNVAPNGGVRAGARALLVAIRGIPELVLAILLIVVTGLGSQAGTLALAIGGIGLLGKLLADSLEEADPGPERALRAAGATRLQRYTASTVPQSTQAIIGHSFYMLDTNIRAATILGIVGGGGVGYYLLNASQGANYGMVTTILLMILATVLIVEGIAMWLRTVFR